jgi:hypothetical protein
LVSDDTPKLKSDVPRLTPTPAAPPDRTLFDGCV